MDEEKDKLDIRDLEDDNHIERVFIFILFLIGFGLSLLALFIFAWACDFFTEWHNQASGWY